MPLGIALIVLLAYLVATGSAAAAIAASKAHTGWLPGWVKSAFLFALPVAQVFLSLGKWLTHHLGTYAAAIESKAQRWFGELVHYQQVVGYWSLYWPIGLYHFGEHLLRHSIPNAISARTKPLAKRIDATEAQVKATAGVAHSFPRVIKGHDHVKEITRIERVAMPHAAEWDWIHDHFHALQKAITTVATGGVALPLPRTIAWPNPFGYTSKQIRRLWKFRNYVLGATGAAAIVATAIGGIKPACIRSGPIGKVARALCGIPTHFLNDLLGLIADYFVIQHICDVIPFLESAASDIGTPLVAQLTKIGAGLCDENKAPATLVGPAPTIPALIFGVSASGV